MLNAKLLFLSVIAASSVIALSASSALAKIAFEWHVGTKTLAAGESREFTASAESAFDLKASVAGLSVLLLATKLNVAVGAKIFGGKPGTDQEEVIFEGVTVDRPANCEVESLPFPVVGTVRTRPLKTEIVEGQKSHEPLILFTPKIAGEPFATLRFLGASCPVALRNQEGNIAGSVLATPLPQLIEVLTGLLNFEPSQGNTFLLPPGGGTVETAGLTFGGEPMTLGGNALRTLVNDEVFGAF